MAVNPHHIRPPGAVLTALIYNEDHENHIQNALLLDAAITAIQVDVADLDSRVFILENTAPPSGIGTVRRATAPIDWDHGQDGQDGMPARRSGGGAGTPGAPGARGLRGYRGLDGSDADEGQPGPPGRRGLAGVGTAGARGRVGRPGLDGNDGEDGMPIPGRRGTAGAPGSPGAAGSKRTIIVDREDGDDGDRGPPGRRGPSGINSRSRAVFIERYEDEERYVPPFPKRFNIPMEIMTVQTADFAGANATGAQPIFAAAQDSLAVVGGLSYEIEAVYYFIKAAGAVSHTLAILFGGTHSLTSVDVLVNLQDLATTPIFSTPVTRMPIAVGTSTVITAAGTSLGRTIIAHLKGIIRFNAGGTFIPQYALSAAPGGAYSTKRNSYVALRNLGSNVVATVGPWT